jgi:hypothetical protein
LAARTLALALAASLTFATGARPATAAGRDSPPPPKQLQPWKPPAALPTQRTAEASQPELRLRVGRDAIQARPESRFLLSVESEATRGRCKAEIAWGKGCKLRFPTGRATLRAERDDGHAVEVPVMITPGINEFEVAYSESALTGSGVAGVVLTAAGILGLIAYVASAAYLVKNNPICVSAADIPGLPAEVAGAITGTSCVTDETYWAVLGGAVGGPSLLFLLVGIPLWATGYSDEFQVVPVRRAAPDPSAEARDMATEPLWKSLNVSVAPQAGGARFELTGRF